MAIEKFVTKSTEQTPYITLDPENGLFEMKGVSRPEDVNKNYVPVIQWFREYKKEPNEHTTFDFRFDYFNTATAKLLYDVLAVLEEIKESGKGVLVNWYYNEMDLDMKSAGQEFADMVDVEFKFHSYIA